MRHFWDLGPMRSAVLFATIAAPAGLAAQATPAVDTTTMAYEVGGVQVIHRQLAANEIVVVNLHLLGGSQQLTPETAGIEALLLRAAEFGTVGYPGRESRLALARTGSRLGVFAAPDWTVIGSYGLRSAFDSTFAILADRVMRPGLDSAGIEVVRQRMLRAVRAGQNHPDGMVQMLADSIAFQGHPYQNDPGGSEASLTGLTTAALRQYAESQMVTSRMLLVVVGNVPRAQVEAAIGRTLGTLPTGAYTWALPAEWRAPDAAVVLRARQLPTNYIMGYFAGPASNSRDYLPFRVATQLIGDLAGYAIRDAGLSYAAYAPFLERGASGGGIYVTTTRPDTTMRIFNAAITLLRENSIDRSALQRYYDGYTTSFVAQNESNAAQADFLARYQLLHGDWRLSARYMDDLRDVTPPAIRRVVREYMRKIRYAFLGNIVYAPEKELVKY